MTSHAAPRSLRQRIMLSFAMLVTLVAAIYGCALYQSMEYTECQLIAGFLRDEAKRVEDTLNRGEIPQLAEATAIYGAAPLKSIPTDLHHVPEGYSEYTEDAHLFVWRSTWKGEPLVLTRDQEGFEDTERIFRRVVLISILLVFLIGTLAGWWLSRNIMKPVQALSNAVKNAADAPVYAPLAVTVTNDEVGELARICDTAMKRLHEALTREKAFTGDVSHELRTPLTVIETSAELLELSSLTPEQRAQLTKITRSAAAMRELLTLFLSFARMAETRGSAGKPDSLDGILRNAVEVWSPFAEEKQLTLTLEREAACPGTYSPGLLGTVVSNLIKNAVAYTEKGGITITETAEGFRVADTGPGIAPDEAQRIFSPGYRGSAAMGDGAGLGLSIATRICRRTGWTLALTPSDKGAVFTVVVTGAVPDRQDRQGI